MKIERLYMADNTFNGAGSLGYRSDYGVDVNRGVQVTPTGTSIYGSNSSDYSMPSSTADYGTGSANGTGLNTAQQQGVAAGVGAAAEVIGTGVQAGFEISQNNAARREAQRYADLERGDRLAAEQHNESIRKKSLEQERRSFALKKKADEFDLRYARLVSSVKRDFESRQKLNEGADRMVGLFNSPEVLDFLNKNFA